MSADWHRFLETDPWFTRGRALDTGPTYPWRRGGVPQLPWLSRLLTSSVVTEVNIDGEPMEFLAWGPEGRRRFWLCHLPWSSHGDRPLHPLHRAVVEIWGGLTLVGQQDPYDVDAMADTWWNADMAGVLTRFAREFEFPAAVESYSWCWEQDGLSVPIEPREWDVVAVEANANVTVVHRTTGQLLLFAPDHGYSRVTPLAGCPEYSLYTMDDDPDLATWIEHAARGWHTPGP